MRKDDATLATVSARALIVGLSLGLAWAETTAPAFAQASVQLEELSVEGDGGQSAAGGVSTGRSLGAKLYGPGGATGPVPGYVASRSTVATKTDTPILETAQSISVISRQQIEDQGISTINQALRYTPGVTPEQRGGGNFANELFYIRGFQAPLFLDGLILPVNRDAFPNVDPYRLERIDIIKGPTSVLYGQAGAGGIVNLVSKVPQF